MSAWLARLAVGSPSTSKGKLSSSASSTSLSSATKTKPISREEALNELIKTWDAIKTLLSHVAPESSKGVNTTLVLDLKRRLEHLLSLLKNEQSSERDNQLGPCLEHLLKHAILNSLIQSVLSNQQTRGIRLEVIKWFDKAIPELHQTFLIHAAINKPLIKLLRSCADDEHGLYQDEELAIVKLMLNVSDRIQTYPELLAIFLREKPVSSTAKRRPSASNQALPTSITISSPDDDSSSPHIPPASPTPSNSTFDSSIASYTSPSHASTSSVTGRTRPKRERDFLLFAYLLRFVHREGELSDRARTGLSKLVEIALVSSPTSTNSTRRMTRSDTMGTLTPEIFHASSSAGFDSSNEARLAFAEYLLDSDFADVLGAGLGALYGLLPSKLVVRSAGSASTTNRETGWDDPIPTSTGGGMVLGGMGALGEDSDEEELSKRREKEEFKLRSLGVGLSGTDDFRISLDGFLKLWEFVQEIVGKVSQVVKMSQGEDEYEGDSFDRERRLIASALTSTIFGSLRTSFLQSVLYPSILECDETDGSAVAVMSYLDASLDVLEEGTDFESAYLGFLMGEEDAIDVKARQQRQRSKKSRKDLDVESPELASTPVMNNPEEGFLSPRRVTAKSMLQRVKRRKSNALILLEKSTERGTAAHASYFTSYGRFTLKDLLVSNVHSSSGPTATAALKLLQTMLKRHDRWSLGLLDVVLDDAATSFPVALRRDAGRSKAEFITSDEVMNDDGDDNDSDVFVYPTSDPPLSASKHTITPSRTRARLLLGPPIPSTPSVQAHSDVVETLMALVSSIDPAYRSARAVGGGSEMLSAGYANYLRDAEVALANDLAFQRGLIKGSAVDQAPVSSSSVRSRIAGLFGPSSSAASKTLSPRDFARAETMYKHKMDPESATLIALVLDSLTYFFSHSPDLNLALTGVITSLAVCPYRSLEKWLLPPISSSNQTIEDLLLRRKNDDVPGSPGASSDGAASSDDGDDRSIDFDIASPQRAKPTSSPYLLRGDELNPFLASSASPGATSIRASLAESDGVLAILDHLVHSVRHYRATIPNFDQSLSERRKGLFFVENLADALALDNLSLDDNAFGSKSIVVEPPQPVVPSRPSPSTSRKSSFMGVLGLSTPSKSTPKPTSRTDQLRVSEATITVEENDGRSMDKGPASPFAAHYKQTGSIQIQPVIVSTPRMKRGASNSPELIRGHFTARKEDHDQEEEEEEEDERDGLSDVMNSPSNRRSAHKSPIESSTSPSSFNTSPVQNHQAQPRIVPKVSLSTILDNVIVLEEFIKELAGIICVRASAGIDGVSFL